MSETEGPSYTMGSQNPNPPILMVAGSYSSWNSVANSYIGCWISLTSISEIRYEGFLYSFNPQDSSVTLAEVRCFGTEGRKRNGPQIPPIDKVYEYIIFRATDMKDFQVKSSPPVHPSPEFYIDTDVIQSQYPRPLTTSTSLPSTVSGSLTDLNAHTTQTQLGLPLSNSQGPMPSFQPGGNLGSLEASPPAPNSTGGGAPHGLPQLHQRSLLRLPPGLSMPSSVQQPMQYSNFSPSLTTVSSDFPKLTVVPVSTCTATVTSASLPLSRIPPAPPSLPPAPAPALSPAPSATLGSEVLSVTVTNKAPNASTSTVALPASLPSPTLLTNSGPDKNALVPPISSKSIADSGSSLPYQAVSKLSPAVFGSSSSIRTETPLPTLVTPGQLLQPGPTIVTSPQPSQTPSKDVRLVQISSTSSPGPSLPDTAETVPPKLPLPVTSGPSQRPGKAPIQTHHGYSYRGRGRGGETVGWRPVAKLTEDFGFVVINEEFKKDEVWGHLGRSNKSHSKDKTGEENACDEDCSQEEDNGELSNVEVKPVDNKDDVFDSLSSSVQDNSSQNEMTRYSEQRFGGFTRYHGGRARGGYYGRGGRGEYYGRGGRYGWCARGRGRGMPYRGGY